MSGATARGALEALRSSAALLAGELLATEDDPVRILLADATLEGETAQRWSAARAELAAAWDAYAAVSSLLSDIAVGTGGDLGRLLSSPLTLPTSGARTLPADAVGWGLERCRAGVRTLREVDAAQRSGATAVTTAEQALREAEGLGDELGGADLQTTRAALQTIRLQVSTDPLGFDRAALDHVVEAVRHAAAEARALRSTRDNAAARLAGASARIADLHRTIDEADSARAEAIRKIASPRLEVGPDPGPPHRLLLQVQACCDTRDWATARAALDQLERSLAEATTAAQRALAANRAPLQVRNELRGRLEAYRAKASAAGRLEAPTAEAAHKAAEAALFSAPCDLELAARLVAAYQAEVRPR